MNNAEKVQFANCFISKAAESPNVNNNIVSINLNEILNGESLIKFKFSDEMKINCIKCGAIISYLSTKHSENEWICEICSQKNETNISDWTDLINVNDIEFNSEEDSEEFEKYWDMCSNDERIIVFCVDTSGSMAGQRISSVREACLKTIELLRAHEGHEFKFVLITFDSTSKYYGNGIFFFYVFIF
jgi:hypothetical protein